MENTIRLELRFKDSWKGLRCTTYINGVADRKTGCSGGGYDMTGTAVANVLMEYTDMKERIMKQKTRANYGSNDDGTGLYGLSIYKDGKHLKEYEEGATVYIDGACGLSSIERIAESVGIEIVRGMDKKTLNTFLISY